MTRSILGGYGAAAVVVLIAAAYPVATRAAVTTSFSPEELVALRFGVGTLLFAPYLALRLGGIGRDVWVLGLPLMLLQGAGMAALVICGLQFAPANHQAALGPGVAPAWVVLLGFVFFAKRPTIRMTVGAILCALGVVVLAYSSAAGHDPGALAGDAMFLAASALGACYVLQLRRWGLNAVHAAAVVTVYSAMVALPWYLWTTSAPLWRVPALELLWQILWQGVLIGCIALVAFNQAVTRLGAELACALVALVPALTATLAAIFLGEVPSLPECAAFVAIACGVILAASLAQGGRPASVNAPIRRDACGLPRPG
jgi:drug/metabolite transporter (DMT)-like permease